MITKALPNQSLLDIVIAKTGSLEALADTAFLNNVSITAQLTPGQEIETNIINNRKVVEYFKYNPHPATDILGGISMEELEELEERLMTEIASEASDREAADADLQTQINNNTTLINNNTDVLATILGKEQNETLADLQTKYNALATGYKTVYGALTKLISFLESTDAVDTTINKWKEIETFLTGITDTDTLTGIIQDATAGMVTTTALATAMNAGPTITKTSGTNENVIDGCSFECSVNIYKIGNFAVWVQGTLHASSTSTQNTNITFYDMHLALKNSFNIIVNAPPTNSQHAYLTVTADGKIKNSGYGFNSLTGGTNFAFFALLDTSAS